MSSSPVYQIVESADKGKIAVATRDILPGELIVKENNPILYVSSENIVDPLMFGVAAYKMFANDLSLEQKEKVLSLYGPTEGELADCMRICAAEARDRNYVSADEVESLMKVMLVVSYNAFELVNNVHAVYTEFTRFSHSCAPNCSFSFRGKAVHCYARAHIKEGEELTITYRGEVDLMPTHERRLRYLETKFFTCHCPRCDALGDDMRQFDCFDPACKGVMMVCQPINKKIVPLATFRYTGVEYVEPHLLPCTVCHKTASAHHQTKLFASETKLLEVGEQLRNTPMVADMRGILKKLKGVKIHRRHAAALPIRNAYMLIYASVALVSSDCDDDPSFLQATEQMALEYMETLLHLFPMPSDNLSVGFNNVIHFCISELRATPIFSPQDEIFLCKGALQMNLLLYGRDRREKILDETMLRCHEKLPLRLSLEVCAFCEESPLHAAFTLSRCGKCRQVCYCSAGCQKAHWKLHKKTCQSPDEK